MFRTTVALGAVASVGEELVSAHLMRFRTAFGVEIVIEKKF
jgi:hypothetical protein